MFTCGLGEHAYVVSTPTKVRRILFPPNIVANSACLRHGLEQKALKNTSCAKYCAVVCAGSGSWLNAIMIPLSLTCRAPNTCKHLIKTAKQFKSESLIWAPSRERYVPTLRSLACTKRRNGCREVQSKLKDLEDPTKRLTCTPAPRIFVDVQNLRGTERQIA